ncbi:MAG: 3'-5' exonuclease [Gaiellaceae bacterium]
MNLLSRRPRSWREARLAALDFETTGLDVRVDHVLSFGVVPIDEGRVRLEGSLYRVVRPPIVLPPESIVVHGIRPDDIAEAPALPEVADELVEVLADRTLVAHVAWFELAFLKRFFRNESRRWRRTIDVVELASRLAALEGAPERATSRRLADLAVRHDVLPAPSHHAFGDALTTAQLFLVLATRLERHGFVRVRDLAAAPRGWRRRVRRAG